jgi:hypothetical protein
MKNGLVLGRGVPNLLLRSSSVILSVLLNDGPLRLDCLNAAQIADTLTVDGTSTARSHRRSWSVPLQAVLGASCSHQ